LICGLEVGRIAIKFQRGSGIREANIKIFLSRTTIYVCDEHSWEIAFGNRGDRLRSVALFCRNYVYWSTVHVHFSVADPVKPCPSEGVLTRCNAIRNREMESTSAMAVWIFRQVSSYIGRASALNRVDDLPLGVLGGFWVCCQANLARSTTMSCASNEA
jgi:hypothetical protein